MKNFIIAFLLVILFTVKIGWTVSGIDLFFTLLIVTVDLWLMLECIDWAIRNRPKKF